MSQTTEHPEAPLIPDVRQLTEAEITAHTLRDMAKSLNAQADILEQAYGATRENTCTVEFAFKPGKKNKHKQ